MTTISDPSAMTPDDPRWLSWFMQQRRFDRLSRKAQTGASLITDFAAGIYEMGYPGQRRGNYELSDLVKYARSTGGGRFNSSGVYEWVGNDVPRLDYDPVTLQPLGLLIEEARTNIITYSNVYTNTSWVKERISVSASLIPSPDGVSTLSKIVENTDNNTHRIVKTTTGLTAGAVYSISIFAKSAERGSFYVQDGGLGTNNRTFFDLTTGQVTKSGAPSHQSAQIVDIGSGVYRCTLNYLVPAGVTSIAWFFGISTGGGVASYTGDGTSGIYIWGAQLEAGSFPTSYIPTEASQVTRAADVCRVNTLSPWYNASEGTLFADIGSVKAEAGRFVTLHDGTINNQIFISNGPTTAFSGYTGVFQWQIAQPVGIGKIAGAYAVNDIAVSKNGGPVSTDGTASIPAVTTMHIGKSWNDSAFSNGHIRSIQYFPRRLTDSELQAITS